MIRARVTPSERRAVDKTEVVWFGSHAILARSAAHDCSLHADRIGDNHTSNCSPSSRSASRR